MFRFPRTTRESANRQLSPAVDGALPEILEATRFSLELAREISRSNRRQFHPEFGLIQIPLDPKDLGPSPQQAPLMQAWQLRLRMTDTIGWYRGGLAILLPETDKEGTRVVANAVTRLALEAGFPVDTEISMYPEDDFLIALAADTNHRTSARRLSGDDRDPPHPLPNRWHVRSPESDARRDQPESGVNLHTTAVSQHVSCRSHAFVPARATPWWKRTFDLLGAAMGLLLLSPLFAAVAVAIKCNSTGPVFYRQLREGKSGRPFGMFKFRTMVEDADVRQNELRDYNEQDGPAFKMKDDPRLTSVGRYLRKTCMDELPQLINVLRGDMSLVGPRPLPINESRACTAWQRIRLSVAPGLTGIWQTRDVRDVSFSDWMRMDLEYIRKRSLWFDLTLIVKSVWISLLHRGSV